MKQLRHAKGYRKKEWLNYYCSEEEDIEIDTQNGRNLKKYFDREIFTPKIMNTGYNGKNINYIPMLFKKGLCYKTLISPPDKIGKDC